MSADNRLKLSDKNVVVPILSPDEALYMSVKAAYERLCLELGLKTGKIIDYAVGQGGRSIRLFDVRGREVFFFEFESPFSE